MNNKPHGQALAVPIPFGIELDLQKEFTVADRLKIAAGYGIVIRLRIGCERNPGQILPIIEVETTKELRASNISEDQKIELIKSAVAQHFDIPTGKLISEERGTENYSWPRQIAMALACEFTKLSLDQIGKCFGGRDRGTVKHACKAIQERSETEPKSKAAIETLRAAIKTSIGQ